MRPVNTDALDKWVGHIPADVQRDMADIAPMLRRLGYDPRANPPDYRRAEAVTALLNDSQVRAAGPPAVTMATGSETQALQK